MTAKPLQDNPGVFNEETPDLKALREGRGLALQDVSRVTKISVTNLEAIETGAFHRLPPPVYSRAYFKVYAKLLEVDEKPLLARYEKYLATVVRKIEEKNEGRPRRDFLFPREAVVRTSIFTILGICLLGIFVYIYFYLQVADVATDGPLPIVVQEKTPAGQTKESDVPANSGVSEATTLSGEPLEDQREGEERPAAAVVEPAEGRKAETSAGGGKETSSRTPAVLIIRASETTWLRITEDRKKPYQLIMQPGDKIELSAQKYALDIGNAGGIFIEYQGTAMKSLGKSGEVVHLQLP